MKRSPLALLFALCSFLTLSAQTNFPVWDEFRSDRFGFILQYPDVWNVNEQSNGVYVFKNENEKLGVYRLAVEEMADTGATVARINALREENKGSSLAPMPGNRYLLTYKTIISNNGVDMDVHHWVIAFGTCMLHCSYTFPSDLRNATQLNDEMVLAYRMIEMIKFIDK